MDGRFGEMGQDAWHDGSRRLLGMYVSNDHEGFLTWFNSSADAQRVVLPPMPWGYGYEVIWHSGDDGELPDGELPAQGEFDLPGRTVALMRVSVPTSAKELLALMAEAEPSSFDLLP